MDRKKISILFLLIFTILFAGLGILWLALRTPDSYTYEPISGPAGIAQPRTEILILRNQVHSAFDTHGSQLIESNFLPVGQMVDLKKQLERADALFERGNGAKARPIYTDLLAILDDLVAQQKNQQAAEALSQQLLEAINVISPLKQASPVAYTLAVNASDQGRDQIQQKNATAAIESFEFGLSKVEELKQAAEELANNQIARIENALNTNDIDVALSSLEQLQTLNPEHPQIPPLQQKVSTLQSLQAELANLDALVAERQFKAALSGYDRLIAAHPGVAFLSEQRAVAERQFIDFQVRPIIAKAERLYEEGALEESLLQFKQAQRLLPNDPTVQEAIEIIEQTLRERMIVQKLDLAYAAYENRNWKRARTLYGEVLSLDPNHPEAQQGHKRATEWAIRMIQYETWMEQAQQAYSAGRMPEAINRFNQGIAIKPDSLELTPAQQAMQQDLARQAEKVTVRIRSDNKTYISVIGKLPPERFKTKELELYPDVYTFKAQRSGYREVEKSVAINANNAENVVDVRCTERL